jgi:predicted nucleotidyltransferase
MAGKYDIEAIRDYHKRLIREKKLEGEKLRNETLEMCREKLVEYFQKFPGCRVYLFGSVARQGSFNQQSDIDIAVENFPGNRLDLYSQLSAIIPHNIDIVILEKCHFADRIKSDGVQII